MKVLHAKGFVVDAGHRGTASHGNLAGSCRTGLSIARRTVTENGRTIPITSQQNNLLTVMVRLQVKFNLPVKRTSFEHHLTGPKTC